MSGIYPDGCTQDMVDRWNGEDDPPEPEPMDIQNDVDLTKPYWKCRCGTVAMPLTDDTACLCNDLYDQDWVYVDPNKEHVHVCLRCGIEVSCGNRACDISADEFICGDCADITERRER